MASLKSDSRIKFNHPGHDSASVTTVYVGIRVKDLYDVDSKTRTYKVTGTLQEKWQDDRLGFENFTGQDFDHLEWNPSDIWTPQIYFDSAVDETNDMTFLKSTSTGEVRLERVLHLHMLCPMTFELYPFDSQSCPMRMIPLNSGSDSVRLRFLSTGVTGLQNLELGEWENFQVENSSGTTTKLFFDQPAQWPYAEIIFTMNRISQNAAISSIIPAVLVTVMSYSGYWINPEAAPGRITLAMICVLSLFSHRASVMARLPRVSYSVWIDTYLTTNLVFNFIAVMTYALVNVGLRHRSAESTAHCAHFLSEERARKKHDLESPSDQEVDEAPGEDGGDPDLPETPKIDSSESDSPGMPDSQRPPAVAVARQTGPAAVADEQPGGPGSPGPRSGACGTLLGRRLARLRWSHLFYLDHVMRVLIPVSFSIANLVEFMSVP